jgi:hypothetical protein
MPRLLLPWPPPCALDCLI